MTYYNFSANLASSEEFETVKIQEKGQIYVVVDPRMHAAKMDDRTSYKIWRR